MNYRHCYLFFVEDDDNFAILLKRALMRAGVPDGNIRRYRDGEAALADLVSMDVLRPSALLLDLELPGMSGLSVLEGVRACERLAKLPAFILSGRDDHSFIATAHALGARGYWVKPRGNGALEGIVRVLLDVLESPGRTTISGSLLNGRS